MIQKIWYQTVKVFLKVSLHFYAQQIKIYGKENIPKKGAVLFAINHPNALMDPLFVTSFNPRTNHFLVRADVFKNPLIKKILGSLNLIPIYRIRDGRNQLSNNEEIFNRCFKILAKKETLIIFPQGGHSRDRNIKPLSKGFTRIVFGALAQNPGLEVTVIPVGVTYQNSSNYPSKVCVQFGKAIATRKIVSENQKPKAISILKNEVSNQLKQLTVHIPDDENYATILNSLNKVNVDFTEVDRINAMIANQQFPSPRKKQINFLKPLFYLILLNSLVPFLIWKKIGKKIKEIEFKDTMRYGVNGITFPFFYLLQAVLIYLNFNWKVALIYWVTSYLFVFIYTKFSPINTEK